MKILMIDNFDSFTFNLVHYLESVDGVEVEVCLNDALDNIEIDHFDRIIISPGPGLPENAGSIKNVVKKYSGLKPILGICLGHQAIGEVFGASLKNLDQVVHGLSTKGKHIGNDAIFKDVPSEFMMGRYHSWVIDRNSLPSEFLITSEDEQGEIMSIRHKEHDLVGLQFHPESILTPNGFDIIRNWLNG